MAEHATVRPEAEAGGTDRDRRPARPARPEGPADAVVPLGGSFLSDTVLALQRGSGNAAVLRLLQANARLVQRDAPATAEKGVGAAADAAGDAAIRQQALELNGQWMPVLLKQLTELGRPWIEKNRDKVVSTPGVYPQRMAVAMNAVQAGPNAPEEAISGVMAEMQGMGLPLDQQDAVAEYLGAFGLRTPSRVEAYVKGAKALEGDWAKLDGPTRARRLGELAAAQLKAGGVPPPKAVIVVAGTSEWDSKTWRLGVSSRIGTLKGDPALFAKAAATVYHEARHAEQDFMIAKLLAGLGSKGPAIAKRMRLPADIAALAAAAPLKPDPDSPQVRQALAWLESVYGSKADYRAEVLEKLKRPGATKEDQERYENLPEESDAFKTMKPVFDRMRPQ